jgi:large subunit ribosomal protein L25
MGGPTNRRDEEVDMADLVVFPAEPRQGTGKGAARTLRRAGKIPAIIYGGSEPPVKVALPVKEIKRQIDTNPRFFSTVFELELDGTRSHVLPREAQMHPVTDVPLHLDFVRAEGGAEMTVSVPVRFANEGISPGLKRGGVLNIVRRDVELVCPANAIPGELVADLAGFDIGDSIHISHIKLPEGARPTIADRDFTIASIVPPTVHEAPADAAAGETATG